MATFQKRNGRVTATVRIKHHPAKSKTFNTKKEAKSWADDLEHQLKNENNKIYTHVTLEQALTEYRDTVSTTKKGAKQEKVRINQLLKLMNVEISLSDINKEFLNSFLDFRLEKVSPSTAKRDMQLLSSILTWCVEKKFWLNASPMTNFKLPQANPHRERVIYEHEIELLLKHLSGELKYIFMIALETGMRLGEICSLEWERIYLDKHYLHLKTTKNGRSREVPLSKVAIQTFKQMNPKKSGLIFNYQSQYASSDFMKARIEAGLNDLTFHDTRHTAATRIAKKLTLLDLCKMFGWSDPKRAMIYYNPTSSQIAALL
ncbi:MULTISPECIES: tyrosine-type recombinase/integrase [unclassified Acinetobacter]|uniref:tyrosine-type recombinase/integrase n=1 Tax=unclassified Acinetobacter TaxID=196816 RepID=UPI00190ADDDA|nr:MULTISPECIES: site-specific integrase [unclassified Acinetobacter]MBK0062187.1 site-specific integrase [Acinetobacter sp. S55]MBK0065991.1 site-specific integrase [Acinetobacter sp. S54]